MAQISKGDTFTNGEQVTGSRLNQLVDSAVLLVGAITDQPSITANTLEATDTTIVNDAGTLKEATIGDILNSNLPITTSSVTGGAGVDIVITPAVGQKLDIAGNIEADDINATDDVTVGGDVTVTGTTTMTGGISGNTTINGNLTIGSGKTLTLDSAPTTNLQAATKAYVDGINYIKAYAKVSGTTINAQLNIASVTNPSTGVYTFTFTTALTDSNYVVSAIALQSATSNFCYVTAMSTTGFTITTGYPVSYGGAFLLGNVTSLMVSVIR